jgi:hypothetical protein
VAEGTLNAVVFWFDLHLDDCETITNGGRSLSGSKLLRLQQRKETAGAGSEKGLEAAQGVQCFGATSRGRCDMEGCRPVCVGLRAAMRVKCEGVCTAKVLVPTVSVFCMQPLTASARVVCCFATSTVARRRPSSSWRARPARRRTGRQSRAPLPAPPRSARRLSWRLSWRRLPAAPAPPALPALAARASLLTRPPTISSPAAPLPVPGRATPSSWESWGWGITWMAPSCQLPPRLQVPLPVLLTVPLLVPLGCQRHAPALLFQRSRSSSRTKPTAVAMPTPQHPAARVRLPRWCSCRRRDAAPTTTGARRCSTWIAVWRYSPAARRCCWFAARTAACTSRCGRGWARRYRARLGRSSGAAAPPWRTRTCSASSTAACW